MGQRPIEPDAGANHSKTTESFQPMELTGVKNQENFNYDGRTKIIAQMDTYRIGAFCINGTYGKFFHLFFTTIGFGDSRL
jgi:hypothetical protein